MSDLKILFKTPGPDNKVGVCMGFFSAEAHRHLGEWTESENLDAAFTYDTSSALYSGVVYIHDCTEQQLMILKLMS